MQGPSDSNRYLWLWRPSIVLKTTALTIMLGPFINLERTYYFQFLYYIEDLEIVLLVKKFIRFLSNPDIVHPARI